MFVLYAVINFSCTSSDRYVLNDTEVVEYRSPIDPVGRITKKFSSQENFPSYKQIFVAWLSEHKHLESSLGRGTLQVVDAHRSIQNSLQSMSLFLEQEDRQKLQAYQNLYDTLLSAVRKKKSLRVLIRRYRILKQSIKQQFSPEAVYGASLRKD